jgi:hypothetical protein
MNKNFNYGALTENHIKAVIEKLGGFEGVLRFLKNEVSIVKKENQETIDYYSIISDGMTGEQFITYFESSGCQVGSYFKTIIRSRKFIPSRGVSTKIALLKGLSCLKTKEIFSNANNFGFNKPNLGLACLIIKKIIDKEINIIGFSQVVIMHEPIEFLHYQRLFVFNFTGKNYCISARYIPEQEWDSGSAFIFKV